MHCLLAVAHGPASKELGLAIVRVPSAVADPAAHEVVAPGDEEGVGRGIGVEDGQHLIADCRCTALVGIQAENPVAGAGRNGLVTQPAETLERDLHHPGA